MSIRTVMLSLEAVLDAIPGLQGRVKPEAVTPPAAIVGVPPVDDYQQAYQRGKILLLPTITVLTSTRLDRTGQLELADYVSLTGTKSIPAAIHADRTLGGAAESAEVVSSRPLNIEEVGRIGYYGGLLTLRVMATEQE